MRALTARAALQAWEQGQPFGPQGRALALLQAALPEIDRERLRKLPIGQRDALLVRLRQRTFGHTVRGFARCDECGASLEFDLDLRSFDAAGQLRERRPPEWLSVDGFEIFFRLPDSTDFAAVADTCIETETARMRLLERCVLEARRADQPVALGELSAVAIDRLGERMEELDPLAELPLAIDCDSCSHRWLTLFDAGTFLWQDISLSAQRLLDEVHALATAYGWSEPQILALSAARRQYYIEKAMAER